jgi:hypothetical protein
MRIKVPKRKVCSVSRGLSELNLYDLYHRVGMRFDKDMRTNSDSMKKINREKGKMLSKLSKTEKFNSQKKTYS